MRAIVATTIAVALLGGGAAARADLILPPPMSQPSSMTEMCITGDPDASLTGIPDTSTSCTYVICAATVYGYTETAYPIEWTVGVTDGAGDAFTFDPTAPCDPATVFGQLTPLGGYAATAQPRCNPTWGDCWSNVGQTKTTTQNSGTQKDQAVSRLRRTRQSIRQGGKQGRGAMRPTRSTQGLRSSFGDSANNRQRFAQVGGRA